jgi:hypothetical protein
MRILFLFLITIFSLSQFNAQSSLFNEELVLVSSFNKIKLGENFNEKVEASDKFKIDFKKVLKDKDAFKYPFDSLCNLNGIKSIKSSDDKVRIFTWGIKNTFESTYRYYGLVLRREGSKQFLMDLVDNEDPVNARMLGIIDFNNWYGAMYSEIVTQKLGSKKYYTLLGWDGNSGSSNIRIIDVMTFSSKSGKLGAPIFKNQKEKLNRVYFEYTETASINVNYESKYKRIMFDHLIPQTPDMKGFYSFYIPDFSYDCYVWKKDGWNLMEDVIGVNQEDSKNLTIYSPDKNGKVKKRKIRNKWKNPNDEANSMNEFKHVARTPESEMQVETPENKPKQKRIKKSKKNNPLLPQSIYGKKKKRKTKIRVKN